jgi:hypothetical protein
MRNQIGLQGPNKFPIWQTGFHDRWMRDAEEYRGSKRYIEQKPVVARLSEAAEAYAYSSASRS